MSKRLDTIYKRLPEGVPIQRAFNGFGLLAIGLLLGAAGGVKAQATETLPPPVFWREKIGNLLGVTSDGFAIYPSG